MIISNSTPSNTMGCRLTAAGILWSWLSLAAALLTAVGYYMPHWISGSYHNAIPVSFGAFRRCNYPKLTSDHTIEIVKECGRYTTFGDIPSLWWQISTILVGVGSAAALLVGITIVVGCCLSDVITKNSAKTLGAIQLLSVLLLIVGGAFYPYGWASPEVKQACGGVSDIYYLGTCQLSWSSFLLISGTVTLFICFFLSFCASRVRTGS